MSGFTEKGDARTIELVRCKTSHPLGFIARFMLFALVLSVGLSVTIGAPRAQALERDSRTMLKAGGYGLLAGTAVGLLTWPVSKTSRSVFIGSSIGLYLGLAVGIYHITHRDDPSNPLRADSGPIPPAPAALAPGGSEPAILDLRWDVARF